MWRHSCFHSSNLNMSSFNGRYLKSFLLSSENETPLPVWLCPVCTHTASCVKPDLPGALTLLMGYDNITSWTQQHFQRLFFPIHSSPPFFYCSSTNCVVGELQKWAFAGLAVEVPHFAFCTVFQNMCVFLKRQYFFPGFLLGAKPKRNLMFVCYLLIYLFVVSTVICAIGTWIITCGSAVWFSEDFMKLVLPSLPCVSLCWSVPAYFNLWNWQEHNMR